MKILDRYIITSYLKTFISVFLILMLIFILQTIWLYIKELAGKELDIMIIVKFLVYFMPKLIPLVLPLTILLSSIMVFGSFAENYEFAAMKSTGISLQRAMSGLSIFIVILATTTFFFSNNVIPWAELNSYNLRRNIAKVKPSMAIAEGQFNQIESTPYNIKVKKKSGDRGQYLEDVIIHLKSVDGRRNQTTIISKKGELFSEKNSDVLKLILLDGYFYRDEYPKDSKAKKRKPFIKSAFEKKIINIDLSQLNKVDFDEQSKTDKYNMLDVIGLTKTIDSLIIKSESDYESFSKNLHLRSGLLKPVDKKEIVNDSIIAPKYLLDIFSTKDKLELVDAVAKAMKSSKQVITSKENTRKTQKAWLNRHIISLHEKFALGFACIILFFVGAPLGALIRKGGIGLPMVIAIILFLSYHFIGIFAINSAKNGSFNPILASWFSTLIMLPLGVFLTKRATADKGLVSFGSITVPLKKIFKIKEKDSVDYKFLSSYKHEALIDLIQNYKTLGHGEGTRYEALNILNTNGVSIDQLREKGITIDKGYEISQALAKGYKKYSKFAVVLYGIAIVLLVLFFVCKNNKLPSVADVSIKISIGSFLLFIIYYIKSLVNTFKFYKHINMQEKKPKLLLLILGIPLHMITYMFLNVKIKEDLKQNCLESLK
nr:LptF/LptG family permease [Flavivirga aquatica]